MYNDTKSLPDKMPEDLKDFIGKEETRGHKNVRLNVPGSNARSSGRHCPAATPSGGSSD